MYLSVVYVEVLPNTSVLTSFTSHTVPMGSESDSAAESQLPAVRRLLRRLGSPFHSLSARSWQGPTRFTRGPVGRQR